MSTQIRVSAGVLTRANQLLICQRKATDQHALKWEFPGGKAEAGEDDATCLRRELQEELGIDATVGEVVLQKSHTYPTGRSVALTFFHVPSYVGTLTNKVFASITWVEPHQLLDYDFLEGDRDFIEALARGEWAQLFRQAR
jgi:8-oxo-dGTP diphosphatase